ncbi:NAD(P)H-binding protein [Actinacidiphila bryophytorum]|uniref:NAD(P)H-binding protein n=1 Tax=Actinacidiphila bryophytorum TaxID=1436133 RepID=UPI002176CB2A|nr:NAD(P)H-binding protein [Actinacidiphila bryophytorum]UWE13495.1 NAD(P)H-binding protein [Actinacidiphila bryophytorum]
MIVVTGATGNVGRQVVAALAAPAAENSGATAPQVVAVSRRPAEPAGPGQGQEQNPEPGRPRVIHRQADLGSPDTLRPAFEGADALFLLVAGDDPHAVLDAAKTAGIRRVVLLSSQGAGTRPQAYAHAAAFEAAVRDSGLEWTVLRPGGFASNAFAWAETVRTRRTVFAPFGDVALPVVDPADVAQVAAAVLREPGHAGRTYELTGPAALSPRERASALGAALGEPVDFVEQSRAEAREQMLGFMPEPVADATLGILGEPLPAEQAVTPDVERVLGRPAGSFAAWAAGHRAAFA